VTEKKASGLLGPASLDALLAGLIDYAGLFPPAALDMKTAVANYARYLGGPYARALGRFVLPVSRFAEFEAAFERVQAVEPWGLSALLGASPDSDLMAIEHFNRRHAQRACVDVIEVKANTSHEISQIRGCIRGTITPYFEIRPFDCAELLQTIHHVRGRAKIRTGGVTPDAFPSSEAVAGFIGDCAKHGIALKATAGLHHPVRGVKSLTYEPQAPTGNMHGFLNVFLATVTRPGANNAELLRVTKSTGKWKAETLISSTPQIRFQADHDGNILYECPGGYCEFRCADAANWHAGNTLVVVRHAAEHPVGSDAADGIWRDRFGCVWLKSTVDLKYQCPGDTRAVAPQKESIVGPGSAFISELEDGSIVIPSFGKLAIGRPGNFRVITALNGYPGAINTVLMKFHAADWKKVEVTPDAKAFSTASPSCASWKAQRAEVVFRGNPAGEFDGELVGIHFR